VLGVLTWIGGYYNKSWKPEWVLSFNMDWRILVNFIPRFWLGIIYVDTRIYDTVVYFDWKTVIYIYGIFKLFLLRKVKRDRLYK
jgi:hypothetical protein